METKERHNLYCSQRANGTGHPNLLAFYSNQKCTARYRIVQRKWSSEYPILGQVVKTIEEL